MQTEPWPHGATMKNWQSMSTAPRSGRPILLRTRWDSRPVAIVARYMPEHGAFTTIPLFGQGDHIIHATEGWNEIPDFD